MQSIGYLPDISSFLNGNRMLQHEEDVIIFKNFDKTSYLVKAERKGIMEVKIKAKPAITIMIVKNLLCLLLNNII